MCKYCEEDSDGYHIPLDKNAHVCVFDNPLDKYLMVRWYQCKLNIPIKYCPICGRKLGEK